MAANAASRRCRAGGCNEIYLRPIIKVTQPRSHFVRYLVFLGPKPKLPIRRCQKTLVRTSPVHCSFLRVTYFMTCYYRVEANNNTVAIRSPPSGRRTLAKRFTYSPPKRLLTLLVIYSCSVSPCIEVDLVDGNPFRLVGQLEEDVKAQDHRSGQVRGEKSGSSRPTAFSRIIDRVDGYPELGPQNDHEHREAHPGAPYAYGGAVD